MEQRVDEREWIEFQWPYLMSWLGGEARVSELAYETGAFTRRREIDSPGKLLQLVLTWAVAERSLRETAAMAAEAEVADVSDVALMKRFLRTGDWLGVLLSSAMYQVKWRTAARVRLLDATTINRRGSRGTDARLHVGIDLQSHRFDSVELTDARGGETLERFTFKPGEIVIADRGYAHRSGLASVMNAGASFIVRFAWSNLPLEHPDGEPFDLLGALRSLPEAEPGEFAVAFRLPRGEAMPCRLIAIRKSEPAAAAARQRILQEAGKRQRSINLLTLEAAGYFFVLTNLPPTYVATKILDMYGLRWQIEMKFKTLKSVLHLGNVPVRSPELLRVYVLAKLLVAVLIDEFIASAESFSPWGYPIPAAELVASH
jgi:IS4 transposase